MSVADCIDLYLTLAFCTLCSLTDSLGRHMLLSDAHAEKFSNLLRMFCGKTVDLV